MKKVDLKDKTARELKSLALSLYGIICVTDCFSSRDLTLYNWVQEELESRGYEFAENKGLTISKKERKT